VKVVGHGGQVERVLGSSLRWSPGMAVASTPMIGASAVGHDGGGVRVPCGGPCSTPRHGWRSPSHALTPGGSGPWGLCAPWFRCLGHPWVRFPSRLYVRTALRHLRTSPVVVALALHGPVLRGLVTRGLCARTLWLRWPSCRHGLSTVWICPTCAVRSSGPVLIPRFVPAARHPRGC